MALSHSASAPGLNSGRGSNASVGSRRGTPLASAGAMSIGDATTNLYDQMKDRAQFTERFPQVRPAGRSIIVPLADSSERDVQPEIYFPAPPTPVRERRFRKLSHGPGEIHVHYGLKMQHLPGEDFRYGIRGVKGSSTEAAMKAGQLFGVAEYKNSVAERVYESNKKEPLGKPHIRGHNVKMLPEGFGNPSGDPSDAKLCIFPVDSQPDTEEIREQYKKSHNAFLPGERINRGYNWPHETQDTGIAKLTQPAMPGDTTLHVDSTVGFANGQKIKVGTEDAVIAGFGSIMLQNPVTKSWPVGTTVKRTQAGPGENFRFGKPDGHSAEGAGAKMALNEMAEDDGNYKKTKFVPKTCEDYRNVQHPKIMGRVHCKQGAKGPPMPPDHRYGIASMVSEYTARSCIKGYYSLEDQLPDQDLGCCTKPGRRNVTNQTRAFGLPSVRTDIPAPPPGKKSVSDPVNYGDECGCAALLAPQRFDNKGVPDSEFLIRRPKEELRAIVESVAYDMQEEFEDLWDRAVDLFDDGMPLVSLDAILYLHQQGIDEQVVKRLTSSASAPMLRAS